MHGCSPCPAVVESAGIPRNGVAAKISAVSHDKRIFKDHIGGRFDLVSGIAFRPCPFNGNRAVPVMIEKVDAVGDIVAEIALVENPIGAGYVGSEAIAVPALVLAVAVIGFFIRVRFSATTIRNGGAVKSYCA